MKITQLKNVYLLNIKYDMNDADYASVAEVISAQNFDSYYKEDLNQIVEFKRAHAIRESRENEQELPTIVEDHLVFISDTTPHTLVEFELRYVDENGLLYDVLILEDNN